MRRSWAASALAEIGPDGAARYTFDLPWSLPTAPEPGPAGLK